jgi:hypothetical protein
MADVLERLKATLADRCRIERGIGGSGMFTRLSQKREIPLSKSYVALVAGSLSLWWGCGDVADHAGAVVRDSAGITIIESSTAQWSTEEAWRLSKEAAVTIGVEDGPAEYQLYRVRSALKLPDGRIVVANGGTHELRFYDGDGNYISSSGGEGGGPGEFRVMGSLWRLGDSLLVYDWVQRRVSVFDISGEFGRSFVLELDQDSTLPLPDNVFQERTLLTKPLMRDEELKWSFYRDTSLYLRYSLAGKMLDTLGAFPGAESSWHAQEGFVFGGVAPFGRVGQSTVAGDHFYYGSSDKYEIEVHTSSGTLERLIRRPIPNRPVTRDDAEEFRRPWRENTDQPGPVRDIMLDAKMPDAMPAHGRLIVDAGGNLWVAEYSPRYNDEGRWTVFDPAGRMLGVVETPVDGRVTEIGDDYIIGVWKDELDVEHVRVYPLIKPSQ